ncbi:DNA polymerase III subunit delta [Marinilongibacter aquaticus]|uniref:DNA polymerase III subunit delta n=1 Tax=Marinilongibacter aquaticus TaxID=2975157 RepID=UPI0021BDA6E3|nr:DNA polymerase III subunit delta [Marinilongibacter aquaticus]UBM59556.1 DNA polymerase III subunit delta [Marinilongibacter aquaticus]
MAVSPNQILDKLSAESLQPLYFLHGTEPFYPNAIAKKITELAIPEHEKGFNEFILFGKDLSVGDILNTARRFPMMAQRQLVMVKDAEQIQDLNDKAAQGLLENYAKQPLDTTVLVLLFGKAMDERKGFVKAFGQKGVLLNAKKLYDNQVPDFILQYCLAKNRKISPKASLLLFEHLGNNLESIAKEVEKLLLNVPEGAEIDAHLIERFVGISKDFNVFELQKALVQKDARKSLQIVNYFAANPRTNPIQPVILILFNFFSKVLLVHGSQNSPDANLASLLKVNPYFVKDYTQAARAYPLGKAMQVIAVLRNLDKQSKGIDTGQKTDADLYKEMIFGILS